MRLAVKAERFMLALYTVAAMYLLIFLRRPDICICSVLPAIDAYCTTSKHYRPGRPFSGTHWSFSASLTPLVATLEWSARPGSIKTPAEFCVEANENTLKVNDPQGLNSPAWSHPPTLLVQWPWITTHSLAHSLSFCPHTFLQFSSDLSQVLEIWIWIEICQTAKFRVSVPSGSSFMCEFF